MSQLPHPQPSDPSRETLPRKRPSMGALLLSGLIALVAILGFLKLQGLWLPTLQAWTIGTWGVILLLQLITLMLQGLPFWLIMRDLGFSLPLRWQLQMQPAAVWLNFCVPGRLGMVLRWHVYHTIMKVPTLTYLKATGAFLFAQVFTACIWVVAALLSQTMLGSTAEWLIIGVALTALVEWQGRRFYGAWVLAALSLWMVANAGLFFALGLATGVTIDLLSLSAWVLGVQLAGLIPLTPGNIGITEGLMTLMSHMAFATDWALAAEIGMLSRITQALMILPMGGLAMLFIAVKQPRLRPKLW